VGGGVTAGVGEERVYNGGGGNINGMAAYQQRNDDAVTNM
jgi:hypothetical protein